MASGTAGTYQASLTLPVEIQEQIIDELALKLTDDYRLMIPCTQVSTVFHLRARKHIFSNVSLTAISKPFPSDKASPVAALYNLLMGDPSLEQCIRTLRLELFSVDPSSEVHEYRVDSDFGDSDDDDEDEDDINEEVEPVAPNDRYLPLILSTLSNLRKICISTDSYACGWKRWSKDLQAAIQRLKNRPSLTSLELAGYALDAPDDLIIGWTSIEHIVLRRPITSQKNVDLSSAAIPEDEMPKLRSFHVHSPNETLAQNSHAISPRGKAFYASLIREIKSLEATAFSDRDVEPVWWLLSKSASTLEDFTLNHHNVDPIIYLPVSDNFLEYGHSFPKLQCVTIGTIYEIHSMHNISMLVKALNLLVNPSCVRYLNLQMRWYLNGLIVEGQPYEEAFLIPEMWADLDRTLSEAPHFRALSVVAKFDYRFIPQWGLFRAKAIEQWLPEVFPLLSAKGALMSTPRS